MEKMAEVVLNKGDIKILETLLREGAVSEVTGYSVGLLCEDSDVDISISSIRRSINRLCARGYLKKGIRVNHSNTYYVTIDGLNYYNENVYIIPDKIRDELGIISD